MLHIAMIGCGAIGLSVLEMLKDDRDLALDQVVVPAGHLDQARQRLAGIAAQARVVEALDYARRPDLLVECAGHAALAEHVIPALERGIPCLLVSIGALSEDGLAARLEEAARRGGTQVELLSGAIGGIDALAAAKVAGLDSVVYSGRKPSRAWKGTPADERFDLDGLTEPTVIFEGSAREASSRYPKNANVAATLSLAGLGLDATRVRLIADPTSEENVHHYQARGAFGEFEMTLRGKPLAANPKTSMLTVLSIVRALGNHAHAVSI
ncbi:MULTISPECIES: aspartate dehydrogenase [Pseudomonas]|jgi:aspartate dehydrogenase|uniref:aspartate dehydrogenase n=1 Tax=Pseudomonas TaxID=286 RepID=UPI0005B82CB1|nr:MULTISPECIES: aspartate dehydrogenase [Pseudomonas]KWR78816.1 aspartate dehydrogenase [Pseudomonas sp. PI1]UXJ52015.1 aspartate dehydrogenase [Pseudomonas citronellolis]WAB94691.1 aspartate dehydrogenase [Pseudomonas citronellolis]